MTLMSQWQTFGRKNGIPEKVVPNIPNQLEVVPNIQNQLEVVPNIPNQCEVVPNIPSQLEVVPNIPNQLEVVPISPNQLEVTARLTILALSGHHIGSHAQELAMFRPTLPALHGFNHSYCAVTRRNWRLFAQLFLL